MSGLGACQPISRILLRQRGGKVPAPLKAKQEGSSLRSLRLAENGENGVVCMYKPLRDRRIQKIFLLHLRPRFFLSLGLKQHHQSSDTLCLKRKTGWKNSRGDSTIERQPTCT